MNRLVNYGSDDENDKYEQYDLKPKQGKNSHQQQKKDDDTNYDDVTMDMSEDSDGEGPRQFEKRRAPLHNSEKKTHNPEARRLEKRSDSHTESEDSARSDQGNDAKKSSNDRHRDRHERHDDHKDRRSDKRDEVSDRRNNKSDRREDRSDKREDRSEKREDKSDRREDRSNKKDVRYNRKDDRTGTDRRDRRDDRRDSKNDRRDERKEKRRDEIRHASAEKRGERSDSTATSGDDINKKNAPPSLMDLKPFEEQPGRSRDSSNKREKERERDRYSRERRSREDKYNKRRSNSRGRSRSRERSYHGDHKRSRSPEKHIPSSSVTSGMEFTKGVSYKVNKKLQAMEKMGLQIKTPDGSMTTAQELRAKAPNSAAAASLLPSYYNPNAVNAAKIIDQVQKRKLLWGNKSNKKEGEEKEKVPEVAAQWTAAKFADGKQVNKFMRLMGIKDPDAVAPKEQPEEDVNKKQEELFQAMQAQYDVARVTTHTMRGVGLGFQRQL